MKRTYLLLLCLTTLSGCSGSAIVYRPLDRTCFTPARPALEALDPAEHIGGSENVRRLVSNVIGLAAYAESLEAAVKCYGDK